MLKAAVPPGSPGVVENSKLSAAGLSPIFLAQAQNIITSYRGGDAMSAGTWQTQQHTQLAMAVLSAAYVTSAALALGIGSQWP